MAGRPLWRLRKLADRTRAEAEALKAKGEREAAEAKAAEADRLFALAKAVKAGEPGAAVQAAAIFDSEPLDTPPRPAAALYTKVPRSSERLARMRTARALVGGAALVSGESVEGEAGALAAEAAIAGVADPALMVGRPSGPAEPLTDGERDVCVSAVLAALGDEAEGNLLLPSGDADGWLTDAFACLSRDERRRAGRYIAVMAVLAAEAPAGQSGSTVAERALRASGLSYAAFESLRTRDRRFDAAQAAVTAARKRAVMTLLEERLWQRAYEGQVEDVPTRGGDVVSVVRFDNNLAFNLLKYGHDQYAKQAEKNKAIAGAMSLVIASAAQNAPQETRIKTVEAVSREIKP